MSRVIYLDLCALKRPFEDQSQPRVSLESRAVSMILQAVEEEQFALIHSEALDLENAENPWLFRRQTISRWLEVATKVQSVTLEVQTRARELANQGLKALDALQLACAEAAGAVDFITCDDRLPRRYRGTLNIWKPTEFILLLEEKSNDDSSS